ncbi:MAG TPA: hypothetical protein VEX65_11300 [Flavisolibacter sp.]|nr:hypothetical protein [Flavisolibacter sp.]
MKEGYFLLLPVISFMLLSCSGEDSPSDEFKKKWYAGKAELSSYTLEQARYGEIRKGEAALIFVTEDFSKDKLVKLDEPEGTSNKQRVLKMNMTKSFVTGIYPYSMMLSIFTPVSKDGNAKTLKVVSSVQEWCGQTFSSLRLKGSTYNWQLQSYFEKEVEQDKKISGAIPEDELWNRIRMAPSTLPQGEVMLIPGLFWQRLSHAEMGEEEAVLSLAKADTSFIKDTAAHVYTIHYPHAQRTVQIYFSATSPYEIGGWQETYPDGFGDNKKVLTTKAVKKKTIWLDYWKHNKLADSTYLHSLQLRRYDYQ